MQNLAIIPARGGSKRIPRKNIKKFLGKPIIAYSIEAALQSGLFEKVMVSTDDKEIADVAIKYGAKVPFMRSKEKADDYAGIAEVVLEVIEQYKKIKNKEFDNVCCVLATAPFLKSDDLANSFNRWQNSTFDAIFPVVRYSFPIQRAMQFDGENIKMIWPENLMKRSQDLKPSFHDAGLFYWIKIKILINKKKLWTDNTTAIEIDEITAQDIDTVEDWELAEIKYKLING